MVNISKRKLPDKLLNKIYNLFLFLLKKGGNRDDFFIIMNEFFSPKEKILFAKRITIIYLLLKGVTQANICEILNVSSATVSKYGLFLTNKELKLITVFKGRVIKEKVFAAIDDILAEFIIQPGIKSGHWQLYWNHKIKKDRLKRYGIEY